VSNVKEKDNTIPKIVHFIWWIPHFRVPIFKKLSKNSHMQFKIVAGDNSTTWGGGRLAQ